ncbi:ribonuclease H-like domain-containing protein [Durotheca rogersii]|uniref:ribonuclease H-like domain-containing protein n=1 Tax=Durotheca rogersii TaxID=419775 RepID=UPI00221F3D88|nr:ribonuclease H-like domain-containing protein [Durotheca rogersii]KAI5863869.1 ribonuclease H-like domain-containing protein [Durotheca rogersii]
MVYVMELYAHGHSRWAERGSRLGAAGVFLKTRGPWDFTRSRHLLTHKHQATSQRSELLAMQVALEWILDRHRELTGGPSLDATVYSDSQYALTTVTQLAEKWASKNWTNAKGFEVGNRDLIQEIYELLGEVKKIGKIKFLFIPKEQNQVAFSVCAEEMKRIPKA